jgi:hypothetical protein
MDGKFRVPKRFSKGAWQWMIRRKLDEKFRYEERVKSVFITENLKCLVVTAKPVLHENPNYHRLEFQTEEHRMEYDVVPEKCWEVTEG